MNSKGDNYIEKFSLKSMMIYICKQYKKLFLAVIAGMVCLSVLNIVKGKNYSDDVTETDVISEEELEKSRESLEEAESRLEAAEIKLENQEVLLAEHKDSLSEYETQWKADIYTQTSADNRCGVSTIYQFSGQVELAVDQTLNAIKAALNNMYDEIAEKSADQELTSYNVQRLFAVDVNLNQNQISIKTSYETQDGLEQLKDLYHAWMDTKFAEHRIKYPEAALEMVITEENEYVYYDVDIFNTQRTSSDKKIAIQNNINSVSASIVTSQNEIRDIKYQIDELTRIIKENEKLWNNTIALPEEKLVSKTSIIIYLILGAVVGMVFGMIFYAFRYMYGSVLRDTDDMEYRTGENIIGTLYSPTYSGKGQILRKLDEWNGVYEITDMDKQIRRLAVDISIQLQRLHQTDFVLTGTIDETMIKEIGNKLSALMKDVSVYSGGNPLCHIETAKRLAEVDTVIMIEKIGVSRTAELRKLRDYLNNCHVHVLGGITI